MDSETQLTKKEADEVWAIVRLNRGMTFNTAKQLYLEKVAKQKRLTDIVE